MYEVEVVGVAFDGTVGQLLESCKGGEGEHGYSQGQNGDFTAYVSYFPETKVDWEQISDGGTERVARCCRDD